jgi:CRP-like cAMP-binding protein/Pyruvate/2-oxoacid:ferredoxin oxidoreductase delta subunit
LDETFLIDFIRLSDFRIFRKNELICEKGEYEETSCIILSGSVGVWVKNKRGMKEKMSSLGAGEIFGEIATLSGNPRTTTIISNERSEIFYMDKKVLFKLMDYSKKIRALINKRYRERLLKTELKKIKIFDGLSNMFFEELICCVDLVTYQMGETVVSYGEKAIDFFLIIFGFAKVLIPRSGNKKGQVKDMSQSPLLSQPHNQKTGFKIASYLSPGQYFGEIGLIESRKRTATVLALTRLELVKINQAKFHSILNRYSNIKNLLEKVVVHRKRMDLKLAENASYERLMDWVVSSNVIQSDSVLLIDLNKCIMCENCIDTCRKLFGTSRLFLNGLKLKNLLIPASCRHCHDPLCLPDCPTGAILRDYSGEVYFEDFCIGCGTCAKDCPFDVIIIVNRKEKKYSHGLNAVNKIFFKTYMKNKQRGISLEVLDMNEKDKSKPLLKKKRKPSIKIATKCDSCKGFPYMGCVQNCPSGAAQMINPIEYFKELYPFRF